MEVAKIYLQNPEKSLEEIAYAVGYRSYSGFELCFRRFYGITPQSARMKWQPDGTKYAKQEETP